MVKDSKSIWKNWKLWVAVIVGIVVIVIISILILRNNLTPEETVSKFMYLIENKEYEKAKKLSSGKLEYLDLLSNIKPSDLSFKYSEDKKKATSVILEERVETTNLNIEMKNTLLGWKIKKYEVTTGLIEPQVIEDRLKEGKSISDIQILYWGESDIASKDEIAEYIKDNATVAFIFSETMKSKKYEKASELYQPITEKDLTVEQLKQYDWSNYEIIDTFKIMDGAERDLYFSSTTVKLDNKKIWIYIAGRQIVSITESTV